MLQLLLGRSGTGKTRRVLEELTHLARQQDAPTLVLLVPEQFSFESERTLLEALGPRLAGRIRVLSFTRLAETVFREVGGLAGRQMDDATRALLMSQALEQVSEQLVLYRRQAASPDYIQSVLSLLSECKQCAITPHQLEEVSAGLDGTLQKKTAELALILDAYEALAAQSHLDPLDSLTLLADRLPESRLLDGALVYVDSFKGFTGQELRVLGGVMSKAARTTVALCADGIEDSSGGYGLFSPVIRTASRLRSLAYERGVPVAKPILLTENRRARSEALRLLEEGAFAPRPRTSEEPADAVTIVPCGDIYEECAWTARRIRRLLREDGLRCRDIAVVARNLPAYEGLLDVALEEAGIPYYMDKREDILTDPLITLVLSALRAAVDGWDTEELLRLMKTGLLPGFTADRIAVLENYLYMWRIRGNKWKQPWDWNPLGLSVRQDEASQQLLAELNAWRKEIAAPLERLQADLCGSEKPTGRRFAGAVYRYLQAIRADEAVRGQVTRLEEAGEHALAERAARQGIRIYTIGIGTPEGAPIQIDGEFIKDEQGEMVVSKLNEEMLSKIAETTGGAYVRATKQDIGLDEIVREINDMERSELSTVRFEEFNEQYQYLLLAALVLLLAEFLVLDRRNPLLAHLNIFREPERKELGL